jgi:hypothetical protein
MEAFLNRKNISLSAALLLAGKLMFVSSPSVASDLEVKRASGIQYDAALGNAYANSAARGQIGYASGRCYQYAWQAMKNVQGGRIEECGAGAQSAYMFADWANVNPSELMRLFEYKRADHLGYNQWNAPAGSLLVWDPGQCGYNPLHGHIEIVVEPGYACSDFCAPVASCSLPYIYVPSH